MSGIKSIASARQRVPSEVVYRVDGGARLGMGHIYKALILEREMKKTCGNSFVFLFYLKEDERAYTKLIENQAAVEQVPPDIDLREEMRWLFQKRRWRGKRPLLIVDILDVSKRYLRECRKYFNKIISMETLGDGSMLSDVVINAIVEGPKSRVAYRNGTRFFLGGDYRIFNEHFDRIKKKSTKRFTIVVTLGGGDTRKYSYRVLDALKDIAQEVNIVLIFGPGVTRDEVDEETLLHTFPRLTLYWDVPNMAELFSRADLAITAGGGTLYEIARVGVPGIVISLVPHQERNAGFFEKEGCIISLGPASTPFEKRLGEKVRWLMKNPKLRSEMNRRGRKLVDGKGRERVAKIVEETLL